MFSQYEINYLTGNIIRSYDTYYSYAGKQVIKSPEAGAPRRNIWRIRNDGINRSKPQ